MIENQQPLAGVRVLDMGLGMCSALAVKFLVDAGADVIRFEPPAGDPFYDIYPAYRFWQLGKSIHPLDSGKLAEELAKADLCIIGGEDFPDLDWRQDASDLKKHSDKLVILDITAAPEAWSETSFPAVEILAQARSGYALEHFPDRPIMFAFAAASYGAAMHGVTGLLAALWARNETGIGDIVRTSLIQGALRWCAHIWVDAERPPPSFEALCPKGFLPFRFECADGVHVHITPGVPGTYAKIYDILGIVDPTIDPTSRGSPTGGGDPKDYFPGLEKIASHVKHWQSRDFLKALWAKQLPGEPVLAPGECWDDPQAVHNRIISRDDSGWGYVGRPYTIQGATPGPLAEKGSENTDQLLSRGPLANVRIVDLGCFAAGPHASVILGDLGAEVIKIERPEGDPMRAMFHHFAASSRDKKSIAIDAKTDEGQEAIRRICASADIVHHNFRPGVSARLGVDAASLKQVNPAIIVLESLAYGPTGPKSQQSGFDSSFQAICGLESVPGKGNPPINYRFAFADYGTSTVGAIAMMMALLMKQKGLVGAEVFTNLLDATISLKSEVVRKPDGTFTGTPDYDSQHLGHHPAESFYKTADGWIAIAARSTGMAQRLVDVLELQNRISLPREQWGDREKEFLCAAILQQTTSTLLDKFRAAGVWAEPCDKTISDVLHQPLMEELGIVLSRHDETLGVLKQVGTAVNYSRYAVETRERGMVDPIGGHTSEILRQCGYTEDQIKDLLKRKVVL